jgi:collagenase-like PrtC family protease
MNKKSKLIIPCHWNKELLIQIIQASRNIDRMEISGIYGSLAKGPIGHGRSSKAVINIKREEALNFRQYVKNLGIEFIYLLNAPFSFDFSNKIKVKEYLDWIINDFHADALMIASYELMKYIRTNYPSNIRIYISTVAGVKNINQLKKYLDINPSRVIPHHDVNRNYKDLKQLIEKTKEWNIEIELMTTESCLRRCANRVAHYEYLGKGNFDKAFHVTCNTERIIHPSEILKSNFIRPEDLVFYEKMGIDLFKITGRSKPSSWLLEVVKAYLRRDYNGNLLRLLGTDPSLELEKWIYLSNKHLENFLKDFPKDLGEKYENAYCEKVIARLYQDGNFKINDGTKYSIDSFGCLKCDYLGEKASIILSKK